MTTKRRVLIVTEVDDDTAPLPRALRRHNHDLLCGCVATLAALETALREQTWDAVIVDRIEPAVTAPAAMELARRLDPNLLIVVTEPAADDTEPATNDVAATPVTGSYDQRAIDPVVRVAPTLDRAIRLVKRRRERPPRRDA